MRVIRRYIMKSISIYLIYNFKKYGRNLTERCHNDLNVKYKNERYQTYASKKKHIRKSTGLSDLKKSQK